MNFNQLPDDIQSIKPGEHKATIIDSEVTVSTKGSLMLKLTLAIDDTDFKVFDNLPVSDSTGKDISFGQAKLKNMLKAINIIPQGDFELKVIPPLIKNKSFITVLEKDESTSYLKVAGVTNYKPFIAETQTQTITQEQINTLIENDI